MFSRLLFYMIRRPFSFSYDTLVFVAGRTDLYTKYVEIGRENREAVPLFGQRAQLGYKIKRGREEFIIIAKGRCWEKSAYLFGGMTDLVWSYSFPSIFFSFLFREDLYIASIHICYPRDSAGRNSKHF